MRDTFKLANYLNNNRLLKEELQKISKQELVAALQPLLQNKRLMVTPRELNNLSFNGPKRRLLAVEKAISALGFADYFSGVIKDYDGGRSWTLDAGAAMNDGYITYLKPPTRVTPDNAPTADRDLPGMGLS